MERGSLILSPGPSASPDHELRPRNRPFATIDPYREGAGVLENLRQEAIRASHEADHAFVMLKVIIVFALLIRQ